MEKGGHRTGRKVCVRRVPSGAAQRGGEGLPQEAVMSHEGGVSDSHQGELIPKSDYCLQ